MAIRPNVVFILADNMGYGDFGCFNFGASETPALDHLVREGVSLSQQYAGSPLCAPSRATLLTGRYAHRTGAIDTLEARGADRLALTERTIADYLRRDGYATGLVGKWHNGAIDQRYHPNQRGFDEFAGFRGGWQDYYHWRLERNGTFERGDGRYLTDVLTDEALAFVRRHRHEPFFLHLAYNAPHFPYQAPEADLAPFRDSGAFPEGVSHIYAMLRVMDRGIERLLAELDLLGLAENTVLVFASDNGPQFGRYKGMEITRYNCGFRGAKELVFEGGIRVPAVLRWPAGMDGNRQLNEMMHFSDWLPTLLAAAGSGTIDGPPLDGWNVLPVLQGERGQVNTHRYWQWNRYTPYGECNAAVRDGDWKLVRPGIPQLMLLEQSDVAADEAIKAEPERFSDIERGPMPEWHDLEPRPLLLFNLRNDPLEQHNLAEREPARAERMAADLAAWFEAVEHERRAIPAEARP